MKNVIATLAFASAAILATSAAAQPAAPANSCFRTSEMGNHTKVDDKSIYVKVGLKDVFQITANSSCFAGMTSSDPLVIKTTGSSGLVCRPLDLDLGVRQSGPGGFTSHCIISGITKLTPEEVAAIPKKLKP